MGQDLQKNYNYFYFNVSIEENCSTNRPSADGDSIPLQRSRGCFHFCLFLLVNMLI